MDMRGFGKKGIMFTLISLLLAGLFILLYTTEVRIPIDSNAELNTMRLDRIRTLSDNLDKYGRYTISSSGYFALGNLTDYYKKEFKFGKQDDWNELKCDFADLFLDGEISDYVITSETNIGPHTPDWILPANYDLWFEIEYVDEDGNDESIANTNGNIWIGDNSDPNTYAVADGDVYFTQTDDISLEKVGVWQNFTMPKNGRIENISLQVRVADEDGIAEQSQLYVEIYRQGCRNRTIFIMDKAWTALDDGDTDGEDYNLKLGFNYSNALKANEQYIIFAYINNTGDRFTFMATEDKYADHSLKNLTVRPVYVEKNLSNLSLIGVFENIFNMTSYEMGTRGNISVSDIELIQDSTWTVAIKADVGFHLDDGFSQYDRFSTLESVVSIEGLPEPLSWYYDPDGDSTNTKDVLRYIWIGEDVDERSNISTFTNMTTQGKYWRHEDTAPSYLYRLRNWFNNSGYHGFETSLNYTGDMSDANEAGRRSSIDWQWFSTAGDHCSNIWHINRDSFSTDETEYVFDFWDDDIGSDDRDNVLSFNVTHLVFMGINNSYWRTSCPTT